MMRSESNGGTTPRTWLLGRTTAVETTCESGVAACRELAPLPDARQRPRPDMAGKSAGFATSSSERPCYVTSEACLER